MWRPVMIASLPVHLITQWQLIHIVWSNSSPHCQRDYSQKLIRDDYYLLWSMVMSSWNLGSPSPFSPSLFSYQSHSQAKDEHPIISGRLLTACVSNSTKIMETHSQSSCTHRLTLVSTAVPSQQIVREAEKAESIMWKLSCSIMTDWETAAVYAVEVVLTSLRLIQLGVPKEW